MPVNHFYIESRKMPFVRLLLALIIGILLQWYLALSPIVLFIAFAIGSGSSVSFPFLSAYKKFRLQWLRGICILVMIAACGGLLSYIKNPLHQKSNYISMYRSGDAVIATINEALLSKAKTYKANATISAVYHNKKYLPATGSIVIYFGKEGIDKQLQYGTQVLFAKPLQEVKNTGNPGSFDYQRYLLFQGITSQVYLRSNEYKILPVTQASSFQNFLNRTRSYVIQTLQTYIPGKKEQGVAEALLIGYRNDLDKQLVQSYSNAGVVHIIAISGLHLGMIYGFILLLFSPFKNRKWYRFTVPVIAIIVLWLFALLAGAVPSILRSAVTFSFIAAGMFINRKTNIYNTLAASAFCLLVWNPFMLWDVGFQLSYAAVLGIVLFTKPIYNCLYIQNKLLNRIWQLTCVNIAAQVLTLPVVLYNFHQFPLLFLVNNLLVIPLSEIILFITLFLVVVSPWMALSLFIGKITQWLLWLMNSIIEHTEKLPFSLWANIKTDVVQVCLMYLIIIFIAVWLLYKLPRLLLYGLAVALVFIIYTSADVWQAFHQQKLVVYNINQHHVADVVAGRNAVCFCDSALLTDIQANSFYIKPGRTLFRIKQCPYKSLPANNNLLVHLNGKTILFVSKALPRMALNKKMKADVALITNNAKLYINDLHNMVDCAFIVADNNTSSWKVNQWKQDCDSLNIRFHSVSQQGAFIIDL